MNAIICEMCGSSDLVKQDGLYVCQNCGCKYSTEEARNLFEINVKIEVDDISAYEQLLERGNTYLKLEDYKSAQNTFKEFTSQYPEKGIGYEKYIIAISENFTCDYLDAKSKDEFRKCLIKLSKTFDRDRADEQLVFTEKASDYIDLVNLSDDLRDNEQLLSKADKAISIFTEKENKFITDIKEFVIVGIFLSIVILCFNAPILLWVDVVPILGIITSYVGKSSMTSKICILQNSKVTIKKSIQNQKNEINELKIKLTKENFYDQTNS